MPYKIVETQDGFNVVNTETGKTKNAKPYAKRDDALKYQRALSAAENQTTKAEAYKVPEAARNNARKVLAWREKYGTEVNGMTEVGWRRARQLADNAEIGLETVKRMAQFARHRKNSEVAPEYKNEPWKDAGYVAWLGWGGTSGIEWAQGISGREKEHDGVMVALMLPPSVAELISLSEQELPPGVEALPPYEMHVTLCYLGDALQVDNQKLNILKAVSDYAQVYPEIQGRLNGYGRFVETHIEETECLYLNFDSPGLTAFRMGLYEMLRGMGLPVTDNHGYTPHVTLAYIPKGVEMQAALPLPLEVTIDAVTVAWGEERYTFALGSVLKESRLKELFSGLLDFFGFKKKTSPVKNDNGFSVFKDDSGTYRWVLISSNAYRDRDGEIVSTKALQEDVDRADADGDYGPLRWWHMPGVDIGETDFNMLHGKMLLESGTFHTPEIAAAVSEKADELQASIAFRHPMNEPNAAGVFDHIRRFERSLVPKGRASNWLTSLAVTKGENMSTLAEKISAFKALLKDDELANHILQQAETKEKEADAAGLAFKEDVTDVTPDPATLTAKAEDKPKDEPDGDEKPDPFAALSKKMDALGTELSEMKAMYSKKKDDESALELERQTTLKAYGDKLAMIETQQAALAKTQLETIATLKEAQKEVKTLMGDLPKGVGAFIASTAKETEVDEADERLKAAPSQDPTVNTDFMSFILPNGQFAPQGQR